VFHGVSFLGEFDGVWLFVRFVCGKAMLDAGFQMLDEKASAVGIQYPASSIGRILARGSRI
jgi:hypothetical protein